MSSHYLMPSLGSGMTSGTVIEWYVTPGQQVHRGDVVGLVDTDKGAIEVEIWEDGEVLEILAPPGTKTDVGAPLLALGTLGAAAAPVPEPPKASPAHEPVGAPAREGRRIRVTPVARKRAEELGLDPEGIEGNGPAGAVGLADVEAAAERAGHPQEVETAQHPAGASASVEEDRRRAMRQAIAAAMARSKREIPHYYLATSVSVENALAWVGRANQNRPPDERILPVALYLKAVALALGDYPELNGFWEGGAFRPGNGIHPGLAISLRGGGLVAPALHDVALRSVEEITAAVRDLVQRARSGRLRGSEVTDATVTVTSLGDRGVETVFGVIYPPQVAIVGVGRVVERPWAENGMIGARRVVQLTLAGDHRASDGHRGALFLDRVANLLQSPEKL